MQEYSLPDSSSSSTRFSKRSGRGSTSSSHKTVSALLFHKPKVIKPKLIIDLQRGMVLCVQDYSKWVICRVYEQNCSEEEDDDGTELSCLDEVFLSLDDLDEVSLP